MATPLNLTAYHRKFFIRGVKSIQLMPRSRTVDEYASRVQRHMREVEAYASLRGIDELQAFKKLQGLTRWGQFSMFSLSMAGILGCLALGLNDFDVAAGILALVPLILFIVAAYLPE